MISKLKSWALGALSFLALLFVVYQKGRSDQKDILENKGLRDRVDTLNKSKEISDEVDQMSSSDLDTTLDRWMRD